MSSQEGNPQGIAWDGTYFWVVGSNNDTAYKYFGADTTFVGSAKQSTDADTTLPIYMRIK